MRVAALTRRPVSTPVRALAAATYLVPVAVLFLELPAYRQIRLIRVHALVSVLLATAMVVIVALLGHVTVFELSLFVGRLLTLALTGYFGLGGGGAICAYQGRDPALPVVAELARKLDKRYFRAGRPLPVSRRSKQDPS